MTVAMLSRTGSASATPALRTGMLVLALILATTGSAMIAAHGSGPGMMVVVAVGLASLLSSVAGFAFSAICGAVLFHLWSDQVQVVQTMIACSIANQVAMVWSLRRDVEVRLLGSFLLGGAAGLPVGVYLLLHADHALYTRALGVFLIGYGAYTLAVTPRRIDGQHAAADIAAGFLGGITGGAAAFPSAPVTIWCGLKGWDKVKQRALYQPFILLMQVAALAAITIFRSQAGNGRGFDPADLLCLPAGLLGTWLGMACFRRLSNRGFVVLVNVLLIVSGLSYVL